VAEIWKQVIPVDDAAHEVPGRVVHAEPHGLNEVVVWFVHEVVATPVYYRVFGTGHVYPGNCWEHAATVLAGPFVWHVMRGV
jgi:hypothetical protein